MNDFTNVTIVSDDGIKVEMPGEELKKIVQLIGQALPQSATKLQVFEVCGRTKMLQYLRSDIKETEKTFEVEDSERSDIEVDMEQDEETAEQDSLRSDIEETEKTFEVEDSERSDIEVDMEQDDTSLKCNLCPRRCQEKQQLRKHITDVHSQMIECEKCKKQYKTKVNYNHHKCEKNLKSLEGNFKCNDCSKTYTAVTALRRHKEEKHTKNKNIYKCNQCKKIFPRKWNLEIHLKTHLKSVIICDQCGKQFTRTNNLLSHKRTHTKQK